MCEMLPRAVAQRSDKKQFVKISCQKIRHRRVQRCAPHNIRELAKNACYRPFMKRLPELPRLKAGNRLRAEKMLVFVFNSCYKMFSLPSLGGLFQAFR
jgi:hypothetical protein